jgi:hypothetical protein
MPILRRLLPRGVGSLLLAVASASTRAGTSSPPERQKPACIVSDADRPAGPEAERGEGKHDAARVGTAQGSRELTPDQQQTILSEIERALARAAAEADQAYPATAAGGTLTSPGDAEKEDGVARKRAAMRTALEKTYLALLLGRFQLTCEGLRNVVREGHTGRGPSR